MEWGVRVFVYGSLRKNSDGLSSGWLVELHLGGPAPLAEVLKKLEVAPDSLQLAMVNHRAVPVTTIIKPGDRVALFPREYPIFADWISLRTPKMKRPITRMRKGP